MFRFLKGKWVSKERFDKFQELEQDLKRRTVRLKNE